MRQFIGCRSMVPLPTRLSRFREIPNILVNKSTWGCPCSKILTPKILFDHVEYVSHNFAWLTATFFLIWGVLRGAKKPLRGVPAPQFSKRLASWTLDFAEKKFQLDRSKTLACSLSQNSKISRQTDRQTDKQKNILDDLASVNDVRSR